MSTKSLMAKLATFGPSVGLFEPTHVTGAIPFAMFTGSRVYGSPTKESDIDLVLHVDVATKQTLLRLADDSDYVPYDGCTSVVLRFGKLNLLVETDKAAVDVWVQGTELLTKSRPISREVAVATFARLRKEAGVIVRKTKGTDNAV